jgi:hypothetical protein
VIAAIWRYARGARTDRKFYEIRSLEARVGSRESSTCGI